MMRTALLSLATLGMVATSFQTGCGPSVSKGDAMMSAVRGYNENIRWQRFPEAAARIPAREREPFLDERETLADDLRVNDYEIMRVRSGDKGNKAVIQVRYMWHLDSKGTVHKTTAAQHWERRGGRWYLADERRLRGEKMPGLAEPLPKKPKPDAKPAPGPKTALTP